MTPIINRLIVAFIGLTIVVGLAGCNRTPPEMTQEDFAQNRKAGANPGNMQRNGGPSMSQQGGQNPSAGTRR